MVEEEQDKKPSSSSAQIWVSDESKKLFEDIHDVLEKTEGRNINYDTVMKTLLNSYLECNEEVAKKLKAIQRIMEK